jgi:uncharacterized protein (DUF2267 family)
LAVRRPDDIRRGASVNYNEMMRLVSGRSGLTRRQADQAVTATLTVLAEALSAKETKDLLAQLPKSLRERIPVTNEVLTLRPIEFVARVGELVEAETTDGAESQVRAVFATLVEAVNAGEMHDVAEELGPEYAFLLDRPVRAAAPDEPRLAVLIGDLATCVVAVTGRIASLASRPVRAGARMASPWAR